MKAPGDALLLRAVAALALASAVSLGLARFSYALLLPAMRGDLGWSYLTAGAMNTLNAAGYLIGALLAPRWFAAHDARRVMLVGGFATALLLVAHGAVRSDAALYALRWAAGLASAASFVGGGLLAARLASASDGRSGLVLGVYYGGTGLGLIASALMVPPLLSQGSADWPSAWIAMGVLALLATALTLAGTRGQGAPPRRGSPRVRLPLRRYAWGLAAYLLFGLGYIGYMTFVITLLGERGWSGGAVTAFYVLLGVGVIASSWLWSGLLQRQRGGVPLALFNCLLAVATLLPVWSSQPAAVYLSGALFGGMFLSVVAATTALVRHNAAPAAWPAGIAAFTTVFAAGQIIGPTLIGAVADGPGGLARGFVVSAAALGLGSLAALRQKPLS